MVSFQALYLPVSKLNRDDTYTACWKIRLSSKHCYFCLLLRVVLEVALAHKIQIEIWATLVCDTNMDKVELQDYLRSVNTLQSAV